MKENLQKGESGKKWLGKYLIIISQFFRRIKKSFEKGSNKSWRNFERTVEKIKRKRGDY